jgi:hypothetical protein
MLLPGTSLLFQMAALWTFEIKLEVILLGPTTSVLFIAVVGVVAIRAIVVAIDAIFVAIGAIGVSIGVARGVLS